MSTGLQSTEMNSEDEITDSREIKNKAIEEFNEEIVKVRDDIKLLILKLNRCRMPKTRNKSIRERVKKQRDEIKRKLENRKEYIIELQKRKVVIESMSVGCEGNPLELLKGKELSETQQNILINLLNANLQRDDGWENNTITKLEIEMSLPSSSRKDKVEDVLNMFLEKYTN